MIKWYYDIEKSIDVQDEGKIKSQDICEAIYNLLTVNEIAFVLALYDCSDMETIMQKLNMGRSTYYKVLERVKKKLSPYFTDMGFLNSSRGERDIGARGQSKDGETRGDDT